MESSSKRAKAPGSNITQVAHCLADGCTADLSLCRDYHRRHKVCEIHSKTPKVTIGGREQRFCQQCSRFHSLVEFDEGKRSCRKRLDGHNRRRRKPPQPESLHRNSGLVFSPQPPAGRLLSFSTPLATNSILSSSWTGAVKSETDMMLYNNHPHHHQQQQQQQSPMNYNSFSEQSYKAANQLQFQFINTNNQDYLDPNDRKMFPADVVDSDRALSLLSPPPPDPVHNYFQSCHHYPFDDQESSKAVVSSANSPSSLHIPGMMFPSAAAASEGPSSTASGSHQTLTFMWE